MIDVYVNLAGEVSKALHATEVPTTCPIRRKAPEQRGRTAQVPKHLRALLLVWWWHKTTSRPHTKTTSEQHRRYEQCIASIKLALDTNVCCALGVKRQSVRYYADWLVVFE